MLIYLYLFTKQELKIYALFEMFALVTTLKIPFSNSSAIFFYIDEVYWAVDISTFLINRSNLSIKKQILDGAIILAYSKYFLGCPQFCLTETIETKVAETCIILVVYLLKLFLRIFLQRMLL